MRAVKTKKNAVSIRLMLILFPALILLAAGYIFIPVKTAPHPDFPPIPTDTAGNNLIGNLPENLRAGGLMAGQNGWYYFANPTDGYHLYMCRENGESLTKITDFPVCNINVLGSSLVFTGREKQVSDGNSNLRADQAMRTDFSFGGRLYAIYGMHSATKPEYRVIDSETVYYSPYLDRDGLYVTYASVADDSDTPEIDMLANKFGSMEMPVTRDGEYILQKIPYGNIIYAELHTADGDGSRIMRIDAKSLIPIDYIDHASRLFRLGNGFLFFGEDERLAYEITPDGEIRPISGEALVGMDITQSADIFAQTNASRSILISRRQKYRDGAQKLLSMFEKTRITRQNGWYAYSSQEGVQSHIDYKANDAYFRLDSGGWSEKWLNTVLESEPLARQQDFLNEAYFTPPWLDYGETGEPADLSGSGDFGSERPVRSDTRSDASTTPQNALDATVMLMLGDEGVNDKYTGSSIDKLKTRYGGNLDAAVTAAASRLSDVLREELNADADTGEIRTAMLVWLNAASYAVKDVSATGDSASATLSVSGAADPGRLYPALQSEIASRTAKDPGLLEMSKDEQAAWTVDLLLEMMQEPVKYNLTNPAQTEHRVSVSRISDVWFADRPEAVIACLFRDL